MLCLWGWTWGFSRVWSWCCSWGFWNHPERVFWTSSCCQFLLYRGQFWGSSWGFSGDWSWGCSWHFWNHPQFVFWTSSCCQFFSYRGRFWGCSWGFSRENLIDYSYWSHAGCFLIPEFNFWFVVRPRHFIPRPLFSLGWKYSPSLFSLSILVVKRSDLESGKQIFVTASFNEKNVKHFCKLFSKKELHPTYLVFYLQSSNSAFEFCILCRFFFVFYVICNLTWHISFLVQLVLGKPAKRKLCGRFHEKSWPSRPPSGRG